MSREESSARGANAVCEATAPELLPVVEAVHRIEEGLEPIADSERVALGAGLARVLAAPVHAPRDVPGHTNSAVDGYALAGAALPASGTRTFTVAGTSWAGRPFEGVATTGDAVRIMTGAMMPAGTDTVVMLEDAGVEGDAIRVGTGHRAGQNVRQAGEDLLAGSQVLESGTRLLPAELGLLASLGLGEVDVVRRPRVATFSTGDELLSAGEPYAPGRVYDSNRYIIGAMLERLGVETIDLGVVRDERAATYAALERAAAEADLVLTSGGASAGEADHVSAALGALGEVGFWRIAIRPGRPLAFGRIGDAAFFGLPGNPVAVMVTFYQFVQPALRQLAGERAPWTPTTVRVRCASRLRKKPGRVEYYRAVLERSPEGGDTVRHTGSTGSGLLHTMSDANCFIVLPAEADSVEPGAEVDVQPFLGLV